MKCSICKEEGHNKKNCKNKKIALNSENSNTEINMKKKILQTEDTGKKFEMAICLAYGIAYNGKYKYNIEDSEKLKERLYKLKDLFPMCIHTAKQGGRYDFTSIENDEEHLSAKSTKKGVGKVAPQIIGQSQPKKFCDIINITYSTIPELKKYIQNNIINILPYLVKYTFDCPNLYYNKEHNTIRFIKLISEIEWNKYEYAWTCSWNEWKNSSTLKIVKENKKISLVEFQFHSKNRNNMAIRWFYENFLQIFKNNLNIIKL